MKTVDGVLGEIVSKTVARVDQMKLSLPFDAISKSDTFQRKPLDFQNRIRFKPPSVIAEIKFASPSEGTFPVARDPVKVAEGYLSSGAAALSILTEPEYFQGDLKNIRKVREKFPQAAILMKDFVVDPYQFRLARFWGADAVLLIAALFEVKELVELIADAKRLGLSALVEVHNEEEMNVAIAAQSTFIGVNNRDLKTLKISLKTSEDLIQTAPKDATLVAESGISVGAEIKSFAKMGFHGFLVGSSLMKTGQPGVALQKLLSECK